MRPPMLVPSTMSIGICFSSKYLRMLTCAVPFAPPPLSTRATVGRLSLRRMLSIFFRILMKMRESSAGSRLVAASRTVCA